MPSTATPSTVSLTACPLCGNKSFSTLATPGRWIGREVFAPLAGQIGLTQCRNCGLRFTNPRPSGELLDQFYSGDTYVCHEPGGSSSAGPKADFLLERIGRSLLPDTPRTLLDFGCGGGGFLRHAQSRGWAVTGYEPGQRGLQSTRVSGIDATDDLPSLPSAHFGLVTLHSVFEHIADPAATLERIKRLVAPNGVLYIQVPNARSLRARLALPVLSRNFAVDERHRAFPIHLVYYTRRTLRRMLESVGWQVVDTFTVGMGIDEFFIRPEPNSTSQPATSPPEARPKPKRRFRHLIRDAFLGLGLGESVAVVARLR